MPVYELFLVIVSGVSSFFWFWLGCACAVFRLFLSYLFERGMLFNR